MAAIYGLCWWVLPRVAFAREIAERLLSRDHIASPPSGTPSGRVRGLTRRARALIPCSWFNQAPSNNTETLLSAGPEEHREHRGHPDMPDLALHFGLLHLGGYRRHTPQGCTAIQDRLRYVLPPLPTSIPNMKLGRSRACPDRNTVAVRLRCFDVFMNA